MKLPPAPQRTTPGFAFSMLDRALRECLGAREFGRREMVEVLGFWGMAEPECVFCGSPEVTRWDHLVAVAEGGETVLGNMVPACARCDDSKRHLPFEDWMVCGEEGSPRSRGIDDIAGRVKRIRAYIQHFDYRVRPLEERLDEHELERYRRIQTCCEELHAETDSLIADYRERTGDR